MLSARFPYIIYFSRCPNKLFLIGPDKVGRLKTAREDCFFFLYRNKKLSTQNPLAF